MTRVVALATLLGAGCVWQGAPVPVEGNTALLAGEWQGTYTSEQTGRAGSILFRLKAGTDSAYGDVAMIPARTEELNPPPFTAATQFGRAPGRLLRISFVRCEGELITGRLDPYEDPETGEPVQTSFQGRLRGNAFVGTFFSYYRVSGRNVTGSWSVRRTKTGG